MIRCANFSSWSHHLRQCSATFAILLLAAIKCESVMAAELIAGTFHQQGPFSYLDSHGQQKGLLVDSMTLLVDQGHSVDYRQIPHGRLFYELMQGSIDLALVLVIPNEIELPAVGSIALTKSPLLKVPINLYSARENDDNIDFPDEFLSVGDLVDLKVGFFRAGASETYTVLKHFDNVVFFNRYESAVKSLISGRIDLLAIDPWSAAYWQHKLSIVLEKKAYLASASVHVAFSVTSLDDDALALCESFWTSLVKRAADGELGRVYKQYQETQLMPLFTEFSSHSDGYCHTMKH